MIALVSGPLHLPLTFIRELQFTPRQTVVKNLSGMLQLRMLRLNVGVTCKRDVFKGNVKKKFSQELRIANST